MNIKPEFPTLKQLQLWGAEIMNSFFNELDLLKEWDSQDQAKVSNAKSKYKRKRTSRK